MILNTFKKYWPILLLLTLAVVTVGVNPIYETNAPMDLLVSNPGWSRIIESEVEVENPARSDVIDALIPGQKRSLPRMLKIIDNLPYLYHTAIPVKVLFNPDFWPAFVLSIENQFYVRTVFRLLVAGYGMFLFLSLFIRSKLAILFGSITFMFNGFHSAWIYWPHVGVTMWLPWMLWTVTMVLRSSRPVIYGVGLALFCTFAIYAWFPSVAAYSFYATGIWIIILGIYYRDLLDIKKRVFLLSIAIVIAILNAIVLLVEKKEMLFDTYQVIKDRVNYGGSALEWEHLRLLFDPNYLGEPFPEISLFAGRLAIILVLVVLPFKIRSIVSVSRTRVLLIFAFIILLISFSIGWELLDARLVRLIPTFSFNPWQRITILLCFSLSVIASLVLNSFEYSSWSIPSRIGMASIVLIMVVLQWVDLKEHYRDYNTSVSKDLWYPVTPTLEYLTNHIGSQQKIMADNSFFVPGTLRYYGLEDWFSHGYKTQLFRDYLSKLVVDPHVSSTAASYTFSDIAGFTSPFFDILCIKYIVSAYASDVFRFYPSFWKGESIPINLNNVKSVSVSYMPDVEVNMVSVGAIFGTYDDDYLNNQKFDIRIRSGVLDTVFQVNDRIYNNETHVFKLAYPITLRANTDYELSITYKYSNDIAIWAKDNESPKLAFGINRSLDNDGWRQNNQENHVLLLENENVPNGIYVVDSIHYVDYQLDTVGLSLVNTVAADYSFTVNREIDDPIWVVLAIKDRLHYKLVGPNTDKVQSMRYMGIFPAFKISHSGTYYLYNRPPLKTFSWFLTLIGIFSLSAVFAKRKYLNQRFFVGNTQNWSIM